MKNQQNHTYPTRKVCFKTSVFISLIILFIPLLCNAQTYHSPYDLAYSPDESRLAVSDATGGRVVILQAESGSVIMEIPVKGTPKGVCWSGANRVLACEYDNSAVAELDVSAGRVIRRFPVGPKPAGLAVSSSTCVVTDSGLNIVTIIDLNSGSTRGRVAVGYTPNFVDITPDGSYALVANKLASGDATSYPHAPEVSFVNLNSLEVDARVKLPHGSISLNQIKCSADGQWAYAVHTLGRVTLPTTHLDRGWTVTHGFTVIDISSKETYATLLLDRISEGAADPWGAALSENTLWVTLAGAHQVARVDLENLHQLMQGQIPQKYIKNNSSTLPLWPNKRYKSDYTHGLSDIWFRIKQDPSRRTELQDDLGALWGAGLLKIIRLPGQGPRGIAVSRENNQAAVGCYFAGNVYFIDMDSCNIVKEISLGSNVPETLERMGERMFNDATTTKQHWLSCTTCHPEGRSDSQTWDLLNDGIGNPKNTKSLVLSFETPPVMSLGVRANAGVAVNAGFNFIKFKIPEQIELDAVSAFLKANKPEQSPYLDNGNLTPQAVAGKALFNGSARCAYCHSGPYYTDLNSYDVGTKHELDYKGEFDTPHLHELWKTAPYLHDGSAATLRDVLTTHNQTDMHGRTSHLTDEQLEQLEAYLLQLEGGTTVISCKGDADNNGIVDIIDALKVAQVIVGIDTVSIDEDVADVNCNGMVDIIDALMIAQYYVGLLENFPCGDVC